MQQLLIATHNPGKLHEISRILSDLPLQLVSLQDLDIEEEVEEKGRTYEENAELKAVFYAKKSGLPTIGDDGGLEIEALGGFPGVKSKRWVGKDSTDEKIIAELRKLIPTLKENEKTVHFKGAGAFALPDGSVWSSMGEVKGVLKEDKNAVFKKGFPYRGFIYLPELKKFYTEEELTAEEMKKYNHRYIAITRLKPIIAKSFSP